jgi:4'-phosphopantetheinyl transferase EntD
MLSGAGVTPSQGLASLFRVPVAAFEVRGVVAPDALHPDEAPYVARAVPKRIAQFTAGRACARAALAQLSIADVAVRVGADREPLWPPGVTGSITHTGDFCGAVVALKTRVKSLGIDAEARTAVRRELWRQIITAEEQAWLDGLAPSQTADMASVLFSAKEALFKCQYPLTRQWLGFTDVSVTIDEATWLIRPRKPLQLESHAPAPWRGRYLLTGDLVLTGLALCV